MIKYKGELDGNADVAINLFDADQQIPSGIGNAGKVLLKGPVTFSWHTGMLGGSNTPIYMYANSPPSGWALKSDISDTVLSVKSASGAYTSSGAIRGSWTFNSHTHTMPSHKHAIFLSNPLGYLYGEDNGGGISTFSTGGTIYYSSYRKSAESIQSLSWYDMNWYNEEGMLPFWTRSSGDTLTAYSSFSNTFRPMAAVGILVYPVV
jgi:hypothetical protein